MFHAARVGRASRETTSQATSCVWQSAQNRWALMPSDTLQTKASRETTTSRATPGTRRCAGTVWFLRRARNPEKKVLDV